MEQYRTLLSLSLQQFKTGDHSNTVRGSAAGLRSALVPNSEAGSQQEWLKCKYVVYDREYPDTQNTQIKARNSLALGHKPTTNFLYGQVIPQLFVLGALVPFPQASAVCLSWRKDARLDRQIMASFWYGNYCIPPWKGENTLGKVRNVRWQVPITHDPIKQPSLSSWPCTVMPAARQEHTAGQLGPLHSQKVLCSTAEFGNKAERGLALTLEVLMHGRSRMFPCKIRGQSRIVVCRIAVCSPS